jgi:beta-lactam-binding protein with PASTA domain
VVPKLVGKTLAAAKRALRAHHCGIGKVKRKAHRGKPGRVLGQSIKPGRSFAKGTKIALVVSKRLR